MTNVCVVCGRLAVGSPMGFLITDVDGTEAFVCGFIDPAHLACRKRRGVEDMLEQDFND